MPRDRDSVETGLKAKGFELTPGKHRRWTLWTLDGRKTQVHTMTSHGSGYKSLDDSLLGQMARQCRLSKSQFLDLVDCPLSRQDFESVLKDKGAI